MTIQFGREICGNLEIADSREWLVTNGIGGYASGTISGITTRRYHGLLVAALKPPLGRTLLLAKLDEMVCYNQNYYPLYANRWHDEAIAPQGYREIESFALEGSIPVWTFACADALLEKRIWMQQGENTTYIRYTVTRASQPLALSLKALVNYRDYHSQTQGGDWKMQVDAAENRLSVMAFEGATPFYLFAEMESGASVPHWRAVHEWYIGFDLIRERERGLPDREDRLHAGDVDVMLAAGDSLTIVGSTSAQRPIAGAIALEKQQSCDRDLLQRWRVVSPSPSAPDWVEQLVLAANQFIVERALPEEPNGKTVIAGYHWFGDWGRDTMISLPGLTLTTGRAEIARTILLTFARYCNGGMLPNVFPEAGETPHYNTVDAALWYVEAVRAYWAATQDKTALEQLFPAVAEIIAGYRDGTRYRIHLDSGDGLIYAGEAGVQLTWMDAKVGDWVVTPRIGKPVEINALWYNALGAIASFARELNQPADEYERLAQQTRKGFQRFWNPDLGYCYDVLDTPQGNDASLRPNQIFAVSLPEIGTTLLGHTQNEAIVKIVAQHLLTSHGLRSLSPQDPHYAGFYGGERVQRDGTYHQGTTWGWLLGPFVRAHLRVYNNPQAARAFLAPMAHHLQDACVGSLSEIFDGNAPMSPRGAVAQAWTVAEVLRMWEYLGL
ncbi:amylo-alpha-1,6-glucosidase [Oscillatoria sp. FACHB-1406]|uniref:amylo-alpha-1,6-glucosidase n=1 Tax=Oscillatoria sp. FACHB-1406 TaxID=2692846 RepID=UPI0016873684|nr:amylo-alpha-1,6-glucosidase [Oscillatoria sp. FACHB-1406]MBD2580652.1 glycogen debranching enzyme family protein [Oscillatoria sp. FACHB-1406]